MIYADSTDPGLALGYQFLPDLPVGVTLSTYDALWGLGMEGTLSAGGSRSHGQNTDRFSLSLGLNTPTPIDGLYPSLAISASHTRTEQGAHTIEHDVVPHLVKLGVVPQAAPDLTKPQAGAPALTLGVRPRGLEPGPVQASGPARHRLHHLAQELQRATTGRRRSSAPLRRLANGRQVPVITTPQMPLVQVAGAMFSRWSQENFFKYLREQFNLDSLPTHDLEPLDPDAQVVNPVRRALEKTIRRVSSSSASTRLPMSAPATCRSRTSWTPCRLPGGCACVANLRRQHHPRACARHPADTASRPRQRRLRPHARSP